MKRAVKPDKAKLPRIKSKEIKPKPKRFRVLKWILIIFLIIVLLIVIAGFYLYNFYVFKTLRVCVTQESDDLKFPCSNDNECYQGFIANVSEVKDQIDKAPDSIKLKIQEVYSKSLYCNQTCRMKKTYGDAFTYNAQHVDSCKEGEQEVVYKITGKEGLKLLGYLRKNSG